MGKISEGRYEVFTTKQDAIDKLVQMQGVCREEISNKKPIEFHCSKNGKIYIFHSSGRNAINDNTAILSGEVIEQEGKTYITFHTEFVKSGVVLKMVYLIICIIFAIGAIISAVLSFESYFTIAMLILALIFLVWQLFFTPKEKDFAPADSATMINELEKRVEAVNLWDK